MKKLFSEDVLVRRFILSAGLLISMMIGFLFYIQAEHRVDVSKEQQLAASQLGAELDLISGRLTHLARSYVITGDLRYKNGYRELLDARDGKTAVPISNASYYWLPQNTEHRHLEKPQTPLPVRMQKMGISPQDRARFDRASGLFDEAVLLEQRAMAMISPRNQTNQEALQLLYSPEYIRTKALVAYNIQAFNRSVSAEKLNTVRKNMRIATLLRVCLLVIGLLLLLVLRNIHQRIRRTLGAPLPRVFQAVRLIASDHWEASHFKAPEFQVGIMKKLAETHAILKKNKSEQDHLHEKIRKANERLNHAQRLSHMGSWTMDFITNTMTCSKEYYRLLDIPEDTEMDFEKSMRPILAEDVEAVNVAWDRALAGAPYDIRYRIQTRNGIQWIRERAEIERDQNGKPVLARGTCQLITRQVQDEQKIALLAMTFINAHEAIFITDAALNILECNAAFTHITGFRHEDIAGKPPALFDVASTNLNNAWQHVHAHGGWTGEIRGQRKNGSLFISILTISTVRDNRGQPRNFIAMFTDISELKEKQRLLERSAYYDALTGLPNRTLLTDRLQQQMATSRRDRNLLAVAFIDLDGFKSINDDHGHEAGDFVLKTIATRINSCLRAHETVARYGGDEFVAVISALLDEKDAITVIARMLTSISEPINYADFEFKVTASIGVTFYPQKTSVDGEPLIRQADQAMYIAKQNGKNCFQIFDDDYDRKLRLHNDFLLGFRRSIDRGEFDLYFQPQIDMATGALTGMEALARWNHPERGLLLPGQFLPEIQDSVLETSFGDWVVDKALEYCETLHAHGIKQIVSINISPRHLERHDFAESIKTKLSHCTCGERCGLNLEILESSALRNIEHVSEIIKVLEPANITFSLDDFGTGYSSLSYLRRLPIHAVKIDQSFIRAITTNPSDALLLKQIHELALALKLEVLAEGVETTEHVRILLEMGFRIGQGYAIARPMPLSDLLTWASQRMDGAIWRREMAGKLPPELLLSSQQALFDAT